MSFLKNLFQNIRLKRQKQSKDSFEEWQNRELDISEILSREDTSNVLLDAYEYCMRKCNWNVSQLEDGCVKDFLLGMLFRSEMDNGGIAQFFFNSSGNMASETVDALKRIDPECAELLVRALQCFPDGIAPVDQDERNQIMDRFDDDADALLESIDQAYFEADDDQKYLEYLQENKSEVERVS